MFYFIYLGMSMLSFVEAIEILIALIWSTVVYYFNKRKSKVVNVDN